MLDAIAWEQALWSAFFSLALAGLIGASLLDGRDSPIRLTWLARGSALLLLVSQFGYLHAATISMTDVEDDGLIDAMRLVFTQTHLGAMLQLSTVATLILLALLFQRRLSRLSRAWRVLLGLSLLGVALARAGAGHAIDSGMFSLAVFNDTMHILAACAWLGVAGVCTVATFQWQTWSHGEQLTLVRRVSSIATIALLAVGVTGIFNVLRIVDVAKVLPQMTYSPYIRVLACKLAGVVAAVTLGACNRWIVMPRMQLYPGSAGSRFAQVLLVETAILGAVLLAAASLGTMMPPM